MSEFIDKLSQEPYGYSLIAFFGANGILTHKIEDEQDMVMLATILFELEGRDLDWLLSSSQMEALHAKITELGKVERRRLRKKNWCHVPEEFQSRKAKPLLKTARQRKKEKRERRRKRFKEAKKRTAAEKRISKIEGKYRGEDKRWKGFGTFGAASEGRSVEITDEMRKRYE
jgi:hypothetical protein